MKRSIKSQAVRDLNGAARNVDLRHVKLIDMNPIRPEQGAARRVRRAFEPALTFFVDTCNTAFTGPGVALFIVGVVFGLGVIAHH
ncbi:hypothetical protein [Paraburkholderia terrae]|uniref:hypothetical protein n=1 Tax=Paraburkholderia terrae TaxID=311230 RepID=UPI001EE30B56|nr:hypothetical protein [Paraburkholderia terrae]GJH00237.1 hypothetical protein CBA19C8_06790 [Paraburkholderia terrae]